MRILAVPSHFRLNVRIHYTIWNIVFEYFISKMIAYDDLLLSFPVPFSNGIRVRL